jgi:hypothetical protein
MYIYVLSSINFTSKFKYLTLNMEAFSKLMADSLSGDGVTRGSGKEEY